MCQRARETDQLFLPGGETCAAFPHRSLEPLRQPVQVVSQVDTIGCLLDRFVGDSVRAQPDVVRRYP